MIKFFCNLFLILVLSTEFYWIEVGRGYGRIYQFMAVLVVLILIRHVLQLFKSSVFFTLFFFIVINFIAVLFSDNFGQAIESYCLFLANVSIAVATALILLDRKIDLTSFRRIILIVTILNILWGLIQIIAFRILHVNLGLSPQQSYQIEAGFGPAFRTEADIFGKFMVLPFLLFFPEFVHNKRSISVKFVYIIFLIGIMMNFTRTAVFGIGAAFMIITFRYLWTQRSLLFLGKILMLFLAVTFSIVLVLRGVVNISDYGQHKIRNFFNQEELVERGSGSYRLESMRTIIDSALSDNKKMIIGNGWGQTYAHVGRVEIQAGGGDVINVLGYSGLAGVVVYLIYSLCVFFAFRRASNFKKNPITAQFAEGAMFAFIGIFFTAQVAGYFNAPEYWMLIGFAIYFSTRSNHPPKIKLVPG